MESTKEQKMKAILVIDVNDDINFEEAKANIKMVEDNWGLLLGNAKKKWYDNVRLKPIPQEKDDFINEDYTKEEELEYHYNSGWNACIESILGEEE